MLWNIKNDLPPTYDFQISLTINCESTWPGLKNNEIMSKPTCLPAHLHAFLLSELMRNKQFHWSGFRLFISIKVINIFCAIKILAGLLCIKIHVHMIDNSNEEVGLVKENEKQLIKFAWLKLNCNQQLCNLRCFQGLICWSPYNKKRKHS